MTVDVQAFDGLIFDCDGTLVDTMPAHFEAWHAVTRKYGLSFPLERFYAMGGVPGPVIVEQLAAEVGVTLDAAAVAHEKERLYFDSLAELGLVDPVVAVAREWHGRKPMAVATGSPRWAAQAVLERTGLYSLFDAVVTADDIEHPKPAPDIFLEAARRLGVDPARCCVFEDADPGLEGARAAGMRAIDIRPWVEAARVPRTGPRG